MIWNLGGSSAQTENSRSNILQKTPAREDFLVHAATVATRALPGATSTEIQATGTALVAELASTRHDVLAILNSLAGVAQAKGAAVKNADNLAGVSAVVHIATSAFVKPKSTWQKIKSALWLVAYGAAHAI
jgi:hypothetical protein